ncbi:hypothetical protein D3C72_2362410 [compost metagenome]
MVGQRYHVDLASLQQPLERCCCTDIGDLVTGMDAMVDQEILAQPVDALDHR